MENNEEAIVRLNKEMAEVERRITAVKKNLAEKNIYEVKSPPLSELFKTSSIKLSVAIHLIMGSICFGLVLLIVYAQIHGCSSGCGG